jgi:hypothetical protein
MHEWAIGLAAPAEGAVRLTEAESLDRGTPRLRELTGAALDLLARKARDYGSVMSEPEWDGVYSLLLRLEKADPGLLAADASQAAVAAIRAATESCLGLALEDERGYLGGVAGFRLACLVADESTHDLLRRLLGEWSRVRKRFPASAPREAGAAMALSARELLVPPCSEHGLAALEMVVGLCAQEGPEDHSAWQPARGVLYSLIGCREAPEALRQRARSALGVSRPEEPTSAAAIVPSAEVGPAESTAVYGDDEPVRDR